MLQPFLCLMSYFVVVVSVVVLVPSSVEVVVVVVVVVSPSLTEVVVSDEALKLHPASAREAARPAVTANRAVENFMVSFLSLQGIMVIGMYSYSTETCEFEIDQLEQVHYLLGVWYVRL